MHGKTCAALAATILLLSMPGCCGSTKDSRLEPIPVITTVRGCLESAPPAVAGPPQRVTEGCPSGLVCHTRAGYLSLVETIELLADYASDAWDGCRERGEGETDDQ